MNGKKYNISYENCVQLAISDVLLVKIGIVLCRGIKWTKIDLFFIVRWVKASSSDKG